MVHTDDIVSSAFEVDKSFYKSLTIKTYYRQSCLELRVSKTEDLKKSWTVNKFLVGVHHTNHIRRILLLLRIIVRDSVQRVNAQNRTKIKLQKEALITYCSLTKL